MELEVASTILVDPKDGTGAIPEEVRVRATMVSRSVESAVRALEQASPGIGAIRRVARLEVTSFEKACTVPVDLEDRAGAVLATIVGGSVEGTIRALDHAGIGVGPLRRIEVGEIVDQPEVGAVFVELEKNPVTVSAAPARRSVEDSIGSLEEACPGFTASQFLVAKIAEHLEARAVLLKLEHGARAEPRDETVLP